MNCPECNGSGFLRKTKLKDGSTVYISGANTFDKDTGGSHKGTVNIKCRYCIGTGHVSESRGSRTES